MLTKLVSVLTGYLQLWALCHCQMHWCKVCVVICVCVSRVLPKQTAVQISCHISLKTNISCEKAGFISEGTHQCVLPCHAEQHVCLQKQICIIRMFHTVTLPSSVHHEDSTTLLLAHDLFCRGHEQHESISLSLSLSLCLCVIKSIISAGVWRMQKCNVTVNVELVVWSFHSYFLGILLICNLFYPEGYN